MRSERVCGKSSEERIDKSRETMKRKIMSLLLFAVLLRTVGSAQAQQTTKSSAHRISSQPAPIFVIPHQMHFGKGCATLGYIEGKNIVYRVPICRGKVRSAASILRPSWCVKG